MFLIVKSRRYTIEYENDFVVYRKPAITNVQIKPHSNICPNIILVVFERLLSRARALHLCSGEIFSSNIKLLMFFQEIDIKLVLENFTTEYMKNIASINDKENRDTIKNGKIVKLTCLPKLGPKLRKEFKNLV